MKLVTNYNLNSHLKHFYSAVIQIKNRLKRKIKYLFKYSFKNK